MPLENDPGECPWIKLLEKTIGEVIWRKPLGKDLGELFWNLTLKISLENTLGERPRICP